MHNSAGVLIINRAGTDPINDGFEKKGPWKNRYQNSFNST